MSALISPPAPGGPVGRLLRSRLAAALTTPHGVDRYLERFNPMWAAHEVRARVVSVHRETSGPTRPRSPR